MTDEKERNGGRRDLTLFWVCFLGSPIIALFALLILRIESRLAFPDGVGPWERIIIGFLIVGAIMSAWQLATQKSGDIAARLLLTLVYAFLIGIVYAGVCYGAGCTLMIVSMGKVAP